MERKKELCRVQNNEFNIPNINEDNKKLQNMDAASEFQFAHRNFKYYFSGESKCLIIKANKQKTKQNYADSILHDNIENSMVLVQ